MARSKGRSIGMGKMSKGRDIERGRARGERRRCEERRNLTFFRLGMTTG